MRLARPALPSALHTQFTFVTPPCAIPFLSPIPLYPHCPSDPQVLNAQPSVSSVTPSLRPNPLFKPSCSSPPVPPPQVVSSTLAGAAVGSLTGGGLADAMGRRKAFLWATLPMLVGPLLCAWAGEFNMMVAGRALTGLAIGLTSSLVPTYISEVAPTQLRGALGAVNQLMICVGG